MTDSKTLEIPFWLKLNMTIKEAAAYSNIGINRIEELLKQPKCNFVLYVGTKKLVKRKEFEQYISKSIELLLIVATESLAVCKPKVKTAGTLLNKYYNDVLSLMRKPKED